MAYAGLLFHLHCRRKELIISIFNARYWTCWLVFSDRIFAERKSYKAIHVAFVIHYQCSRRNLTNRRCYSSKHVPVFLACGDVSIRGAVVSHRRYRGGARYLITPLSSKSVYRSIRVAKLCKDLEFVSSNRHSTASSNPSIRIDKSV